MQSDAGWGWVRSLQSLREGVFLLMEGARFLRRERRLWTLSLIPMLFALLFVVVAASLFWVRLEGIHAFWVASLPVIEAGAWWSWSWVGPGRLLLWLLGWLAVVASFAVSLVAALLLANLASAPFLDRLSQRVEAIAGGREFESEQSAGSAISGTFKSFAAELRRLVFLAGVWLVLSVAGVVIPGAQLVTAPMLIAATILFLPLDYAGFALDRRGVSFRARRDWLLDNLSLMFGFGGVAFVACLVPGLNLLVMPAQVTAGTLLVARRTPSRRDRE